MATLEQIAQAQTDFLAKLKEDLDTVVSAAYRQYGYTHIAIVTDDLEKDYQDITTANPDLANVSAVGLLAILSDGDTVTAQGNRMFINGEEEQSDYSFSGENSQNGIEFVKIWYFEKDGSLSPEKPVCVITKIVSKTISATPELAEDFFDYAYEIEYDTSLARAPLAVRKQTYTGVARAFNVSTTTEKYQDYRMSSWIKDYNYINNYAALKEAVFQNLLTITDPSITGATGTAFIKNCPNLDLIIPNLQRIDGTLVTANIAIYNIQSFTVPDTATYIGCSAIGSVKKLTLNCKDAEFYIHNIQSYIYSYGWYAGTAPEKFEMCEDWGASINLSKVAANWLNDDYIDLMTKKLRDMTETNETRKLTLLNAHLTRLQETEQGLAAIEAATDKGWTIGGI